LIKEMPMLQTGPQPGMITRVEDYFVYGCGRCARFATPDCSTKAWATGLTTLRRIALDAGLTETAKWGHPCFMHESRNIAIIGAFRGDFRLTFMNAALMLDPEAVLEKQGPNSHHADCLRFTDTATPAALEPLIRAYLAEAMGYAKAGILPPKERVDLDLPLELVEALDADPDLAEAFHALTPGRQKSYVLILNDAKTSATRLARIAKSRPKILAGKGATER
jgi:uncharacterized protein YdeI (YjbR/CyaY-like superfamily)